MRLWWVFISFFFFATSYPNLFVPPLLIPLQTSRKVASPEGALFYDGWLSSSPGTSPRVGACSSYAVREAEEGETALEEMEMEMQPCHGTHHHLLEHSDDHHGMEVGSGWETCEYKNDWE